MLYQVLKSRIGRYVNVYGAVHFNGLKIRLNLYFKGTSLPILLFLYHLKQYACVV